MSARKEDKFPKKPRLSRLRDPVAMHGNQYRAVARLENEAVLDRMQARIAQRPDILDQRRETVEHPFGTIKQWMNQGAFLMRGLEKVRAEFSLTALAYNLRRVLNIVGLPKLIPSLPPSKPSPSSPSF